MTKKLVYQVVHINEKDILILTKASDEHNYNISIFFPATP